ncbi:MAG TPA: hypothetical protein VHD31_01015 [Candidatus Paceibacterota bacterium]|nr:hypothetical protein [Candidatus Paceibacterota bacterium]
MRMFWLIFVLVIGFILVDGFIPFVTQYLGYSESSTFFGAFQGFATDFLALVFSYALWVSVIFGALGKKADYIIITLYAFLGFFLLYNLSLKIYLGFIGVTILGNLIGFCLKLWRQRFFKNSWVGR